MNHHVYVGCRTTRERNARGRGITVWRHDAASGALRLVQEVDGLVNPSYLALGRTARVLYTVHGDASEISAYRIDPHSGRLAFLNRRATEGRNPVHLAVSPDGRHIVVSNHLSGTLAVLPLAEDGALLPVSQTLALHGEPGPHRVEQPHAKPHFNPFDPTGRHVVVPDKGLDRIFSFRFEDGRLSPAAAPCVPAREGAGPRHIAFHPSAPLAYAVNELDSTVTAYRHEAATGALTPFQVLPTLPDSCTGNSRAAAIAIDARGRHLYASNRGDDSIALFHIESAGGRLRFIRAYGTGGRTPRFFTLDPQGRFLYAANEDSDTIVAFHVDAASGELTHAGIAAETGSPVCMVFRQASP
ncbi:lactonase family protein [Bordetella bronchialis]|uniref:Hemagglutinin n=1 Tax=Bordetella bronchialis TaxID=463025 RepID=A0ABM6CWD3_9BORD|nr:beta-propeller fold lactonase family protein [Bordetella bronchialis]ANN68429.1 hemagglutinin [Bordetella bronchialis]